MADDATPDLLSLEDLLPGELAERLQTLAPGIAWALESFAVSFSGEVARLDQAAQEAFARLTLNYGESLDNFLRLAAERVDPDQVQERAHKMALLRELDLFSQLNAFDLGQIAAAFQRTEYRQGQELARQGEEGQAVYFLESGRVGIIVDGNQVAIRGAGSLFGETSVITAEPVNATLRAVSPCVALRITREDFQHLVMGLPELVPKIARIGFTRLEEATHRLSEVLGHMPDALLKIDRDGVIAGDISGKCFQYLGEEVLTGKSFSAVAFRDDPDQRAAWDQALPLLWDDPRRYQDPGFEMPREVDYELHGVGLRHYEFNLMPCYRRGICDGFDVAIADVTERRQVEAERARMERALERRRRKFMLFRLAGQRFGLEIETVREIIETPPVTRLPNAPAYLRGFFNLRGHIIACLDLRVLLELAPDAPADAEPAPADAESGAENGGTLAHTGSAAGHERVDSCVFIVEVAGLEGAVAVGLLADGVDEILDVFEQDITPSADLSMLRWNLDFLHGVARTDEGEHLLLNPDRLIGPHRQRELAALGAANSRAG